jgi:hypothetical protein
VEKRLYTREEIGFNGQAVGPSPHVLGGRPEIHTGPGGNLIDHDGPLAFKLGIRDTGIVGFMDLSETGDSVEEIGNGCRKIGRPPVLAYCNNRCGSRNKLIFQSSAHQPPLRLRSAARTPSLSLCLALLGGGGSLL